MTLLINLLKHKNSSVMVDCDIATRRWWFGFKQSSEVFWWDIRTFVCLSLIQLVISTAPASERIWSIDQFLCLGAIQDNVSTIFRGRVLSHSFFLTSLSSSTPWFPLPIHRSAHLLHQGRRWAAHQGYFDCQVFLPVAWRRSRCRMFRLLRGSTRLFHRRLSSPTQRSSCFTCFWAYCSFFTSRTVGTWYARRS